MKTSESIKELAGALAKAQGAIKGAAKDRLNPHFKSSYADLASVWEACRAQLAANGIAVIQGVEADGPTVKVETTLAHASGEWMTSILSLTANPATPQGVGSAITYGRRYGLSSMVGIAPDDDDGEAASAAPPAPRAQTPAKPQPAQTESPAHVAAAWEKFMVAYGNKAAALDPWKVALAKVIGKDRDSKSMTQKEALDVEALCKPPARTDDIEF